MKTTPCACGALLYVPDAMDLWEEQVLAHVRTRRHQDWWERAQLRSEAVPILDVTIAPGGMLSPIAMAPVSWVGRARLDDGRRAA